MDNTRSLLGSNWPIQDLWASIERDASLSPEEGASKFATFLDGWPIPPGLQDKLPQFVVADYHWSGQRFAFWYGVEIYWRNISPDHWDPNVVISSLDLSGVVSGEVRGIRHSQITNGSFGNTAPSIGQKHKVVSTLSSTSLKAGNYGLTLYAGSATFAWLNDVLFYFVTAAGISIDGEGKWSSSFIT